MSTKHAIFNLNEVLDDDDLNCNVIIQLPSETIEIDYYQLLKWSKVVRNEYPQSAIKQLVNTIQKYQQQFHIKEENVKSFFKYISEERVQITLDQYFDHQKLAKLLSVTKYERVLQKFSQDHIQDVDFIIKLLIEQNLLPEMENLICKISPDMEDTLSNNLDRCLKNPDFFILPITQIARIIEKSQKQIPSNLLYSFIKKSLDSRFILFSFLQIKDLSDENFFDLCNSLSKRGDEATQRYTQYIKNDFLYLKELKEKIKNLTNENEQIKTEKVLLNKEIQKLTNENNQLKNDKSNLSSENNKIKKDKNSLFSEVTQLKKSNSSLSAEIEKLKKDKMSLSNNNNQLAEQKSKLQKQVDALKKLCDDLVVERNKLKEEKNGTKAVSPSQTVTFKDNKNSTKTVSTSQTAAFKEDKNERATKIENEQEIKISKPQKKAIDIQLSSQRQNATVPQPPSVSKQQTETKQQKQKEEISKSQSDSNSPSSSWSNFTDQMTIQLHEEEENNEDDDNDDVFSSRTREFRKTGKTSRQSRGKRRQKKVSMKQGNYSFSPK